MDVAALSMSMAQTSALSDVGTAMLSKSLDTSEQMGASLVNMIDRAAMEQSVNPHIGGNFDMTV